MKNIIILSYDGQRETGKWKAKGKTFTQAIVQFSES